MPAQSTRPNTQQRLITGCVMGSLLLHALLLFALPGASRTETALPPVLDVQLLAPVSETAVAAKPEPQHTARQKPVRIPAPPAALAVAGPSVAAPAVIAADAAAPAAEAPRVTTTATATAATAATGTAARSEVVTAPSFSAAYLRNPPPAYPPAARRNGEEGLVTLKVLVTADGAPARVELERSSGSRLLDGAAIEAVRGWRFQPARRGSQAIEEWALVPLRFRLDS